MNQLWTAILNNVNPELINPSWLILVVPPVINGYWNGTPQIKQPKGLLPSGKLAVRHWKMAIEIVALPIENAGFP